MSNILGLGYFVYHDSNAALIDEKGKVLFNAANERFSRIKKDGDPPRLVLSEIEKRYGNNFKMVCADYKTNRVLRERYATGEDNKVKKNFLWFSSLFPNFLLDGIPYGYYLLRHGKTLPKERVFSRKNSSYFSGHHDSHAATAYYTSGFKRALIITYDAGITCEPWLVSVQKGEDGELSRLFLKKNDNKEEAWAGKKYSAITKLLGFKPNRHEGKITGLAAYGKYSKECIEKVNASLNDRSLGYERNVEPYMWLLEEFSKEDIAYAIQHIAEEVVLKLVEKARENEDSKRIALAGGVFSNVRINQKVKEMGFKEVFIHPGMGDDGMGFGAALYYLGKEKGLKPYKLKDVYFGPEYSDEEIKRELEKNKLKYEHVEGIEYQIAELIAKGKVVARFNGRMEYGPRALGNRSILYQTSDRSVNDWLNKRLKRSEFMPFGPATLKEYASKCYKNLEGAEHAAEFMTITFDCTDWMKENCPAVVHVDGTARPQLVRREVNPSFYKIIDEYRKITGIPSIVNTSYNVHEEPIVCSPNDAIRSFLTTRLDYLAIGNFLVRRD